MSTVPPEFDAAPFFENKAVRGHLHESGLYIYAYWTAHGDVESGVVGTKSVMAYVNDNQILGAITDGRFSKMMTPNTMARVVNEVVPAVTSSVLTHHALIVSSQIYNLVTTQAVEELFTNLTSQYFTDLHLAKAWLSDALALPKRR